jgi:hypothetical protein
MASPNYELTERISDQSIDYLFISKGKTDIIKVIQYIYFTELYGKSIFNLGFGDYDLNKDKINDSVNTDNGDVYKVFNTVLATIPKFFDIFRDAMLMVQGSDSKTEFTEKCRLTCKKKCTSYCKNQHRRISVYTYYVNKNFETLKDEYTFWGGVKDDNGTIQLEPYIPQKKYGSVFVMKKISKFVL